MTTKNYYREGQLAQRLAELGCREVEIETYLQADRAGDRALDLDAMNSQWAESERTTDATAHRWVGGINSDEQLCREAFGDKPNLTAQGQLVSRYGKAFAEDAAARYGATLGSLKPGIDPNAKADTKGERNPWSAKFKGGDAAAERIRIIKTLGTKAAASMASAAGADLAGRPLRGRAA